MIRIRYRPTELSEGAIDLIDADKFVVLDDNTVELRKRSSTGKYKVVGFVHPDRWESVTHADVDA